MTESMDSMITDSTSQTVQTIVPGVIAGQTDTQADVRSDTQANIQADTQENTVAAEAMVSNAEPAVPTMQNEDNAEMEVPMESRCSNMGQPEEQERTSGKGQKEEQAEKKVEENAESERKESPSVVSTSTDFAGISPEPIVQAPTPKKRPSLRPVFSIDVANGNMASMNGSHGS